MSKDKTIREEIKAAAPDIANTEWAAPIEIENAIAARQRQILRNNAVATHIGRLLARKRGDHEEEKVLSKQLDRWMRDMAELDGLYPGAKKQMENFDQKAIGTDRL